MTNRAIGATQSRDLIQLMCCLQREASLTDANEAVETAGMAQMHYMMEKDRRRSWGVLSSFTKRRTTAAISRGERD